LILAKILLSLTVLLYASWSDYKIREVSNRVWVIYAPLALTLTLLELTLYDSVNLPFFALSFGLTAFIALILFYSGAFGGADSKALMCIALALPFAPTTLLYPLSGLTSPISLYLFPMTILTNAVLFAALSCVYMVLRNVVWHKRHGKKLFEGSLSSESWSKKLLVIVTGYKFPIAKVQAKWHIYPMEDIEQTDASEVKRKLMIIPKDEGREKTVERLASAVSLGKIDGYVWATPGLPMLIFVTLGLIVALFFGDIVWVLMRLI
jgi:archaeal preflagellin peptidase FlaK